MLFGWMNSASQNLDQSIIKELNHGTFEVYDDKNNKICVVYRKNNFQLEKYRNVKKFNIVSFKPSQGIYYLKTYLPKYKADTVTYAVKYKKIDHNTYTFSANPAFLKMQFNSTGTMLKTSNDISEKATIFFNNLKNPD